MRLIRDVAAAAATNAHWYEPFKGTGSPVPVADRIVSDAGLKRLLPSAAGIIKDLARWRTQPSRETEPLPVNAVAIVLSNKVQASLWNKVGDRWSCCCCGRSREQIIGRANDGEITFDVRPTPNENGWRSGSPFVCGECFRILQCLKTEVTDLLKRRPESSYTFVTPGSLRAVIRPTPNQRHQVLAGPSLELVQEIVSSSRLEGSDYHSH